MNGLPGKARVAALFALGPAAGPAYAQQQQMLPAAASAGDQFVILACFAVAVAAVFAYLARDALLRRKTGYDGQSLGSKEDREHEKYHSDWADYFEDVGSRTRRTGGGGGGGGGDGDGTMPDAGDLPDPYEVMGVEIDATQERIKERYRELAKASHPDRNTEEDAGSRMARINRAYEILSDPQTRAEYDRRRAS